MMIISEEPEAGVMDEGPEHLEVGSGASLSSSPYSGII
jgi:hypothetical protein